MSHKFKIGDTVKTICPNGPKIKGIVYRIEKYETVCVDIYAYAYTLQHKCLFPSKFEDFTKIHIFEEKRLNRCRMLLIERLKKWK